MKAIKKIEKRYKRKQAEYDLLISTPSLQGDCFKKHGTAGFKRPGSRKKDR